MNNKLVKFLIILTVFAPSFIFLNNCSLENADIVKAPAPEDLQLKRERERRERERERGQNDPDDDENIVDQVFGNIFKGDSKNNNGGTGIAVNAYLWRASLDTLSFMPLLSADPFGGVIITDWYSNSEKPKEKFKIVAYILDKSLRVDAIKIAVFKKIKNENGEWIDNKSNKVLKNKVEDAILTKARKLKIQSIK
ncbi:DUF3576 domain-containing protein [Alphaproteobacteria bacterium]|nr:DUF3576 domain-containing protein [Alphaproteobacteria bacterium]